MTSILRLRPGWPWVLLCSRSWILSHLSRSKGRQPAKGHYQEAFLVWNKACLKSNISIFRWSQTDLRVKNHRSVGCFWVFNFGWMKFDTNIATIIETCESMRWHGSDGMIKDVLLFIKQNTLKWVLNESMTCSFTNGNIQNQYMTDLVPVQCEAWSDPEVRRVRMARSCRWGCPLDQ